MNHKSTLTEDEEIIIGVLDDLGTEKDGIIVPILLLTQDNLPHFFPPSLDKPKNRC